MLQRRPFFLGIGQVAESGVDVRLRCFGRRRRHSVEEPPALPEHLLFLPLAIPSYPSRSIPISTSVSPKTSPLTAFGLICLVRLSPAFISWPFCLLPQSCDTPDHPLIPLACERLAYRFVPTSVIHRLVEFTHLGVVTVLAGRARS